MKSIDDTGPAWVPIAEAARELETTPLNVLMHIKRGSLVGQESAGSWQVAAASLLLMQDRRGRGDLPAVCQSACSKAGGCANCS
jgi:hypothetical protein